MKKATLEQRLLASRPADTTNHAFVTRTMDAVRIARGNETFSDILRTTNATKKEHLFMKLRHLPRFAAISIIIAGLAAVSGTAYAAYQLWLKPTATVQSSSHNQALIKLRNCEQYGGNTGLHVVINKSSGLSAAETAKYIQANCEINAVQSWAMATFQGKVKAASDILLPYSIQAVQGNAITLHDGSALQHIQVNSQTIYAANGALVTKKAIAAGDTVAYVVDEKDGALVRAIVKLNLPFKYYSSNSDANAFFVRNTCSGDPQAWCVNADSLDVLHSGEAGANPSATGNWYEIQGALVSHSATAFTIKDTSGVTHIIPTTSNIIATFNAGNTYGNISINTDDVLDVTYRQPTTANHGVVRANQVESVELLMSKISKQSGPTNSQKYHY
ncbi:MAG TPA: hypothetical protein VGG13_02680 [Candidatus Saccharimonadales bacterium]|jgi:hypothetical protein